MTGAELAAIRLAAGLTQQQLAEQAGIGRHAVSYWETKPRVDRRSWAVCRIGEVLPLPPVYEPPAPVLTLADLAMQSGLAAQVSRLLMRCGQEARPVQCADPKGHSLPMPVRAGQAALQVSWGHVLWAAHDRG